jgi:hypothetical protein
LTKIGLPELPTCSSCLGLLIEHPKLYINQ